MKNAALLPVAAASASFFEQFAPSRRDLGESKDTAAPAPANAAKEGYANADRAGLKEIVATVTTSDNSKPGTGDSIADILNEETIPDGSPERN
ncbi:MAG: hypothetical protein K2X68_09105 [Novosphingobium sp.]|nr:hypothetical protein [Novosphingobium sp.]